MGLFSRKPKARFETITIDRESEVFRALEKKGYILCDEPFQFDVEKPTEKIRKDARSVAKNMKGELILEIFDPVYQMKPWKGLRYAVWRKATNEELMERRKKEQMKHRPNYGDTMGSYDDIEKNLDQKKIHVSEDDLKALDSVVGDQKIDVNGDMQGKSSEELERAEEAIKAVSTFDPYDHQGEMAEEEQPSSGPVFQESMDIDSDMPTEEDSPAPEEVDAMSMMQDIAGTPEGSKEEGQQESKDEEKAPAEAQQGQVPQEVQRSQPPAQTRQGQIPQEVQQSQPPAQTRQGQVPQEVQQSQPPAQTRQGQVPSPPEFQPPPQPPQRRDRQEDEEK